MVAGWEVSGRQTQDERSTLGEEKTENKSFDGVDLTSFLVEDRKFCLDTAIDPPA